MIKVYGHRGNSSQFKENTIESFESAFKLGAHGVELDVQLSLDGEIVVIHDENIKRTTSVDAEVKSLTYSELKKYNIPLLRDVIVLAQNYNAEINIELKTNRYDYAGIEKKVYDLIAELDYFNKIIISSFNKQSIINMFEIDNKVKCALIYGRDFEYLTALNGIKLYAVHPEASTMSKDIINKLKDDDCVVNLWISAELREFAEFVIDLCPNGIITNFPEQYIAR